MSNILDQKITNIDRVVIYFGIQRNEEDNQDLVFTLDRLKQLSGQTNCSNDVYYKWLRIDQGYSINKEGSYKEIVITHQNAQNNLIGAIMQLNKDLTIKLRVKIKKRGSYFHISGQASVNLINMLKPWLIFMKKYNDEDEKDFTINKSNYFLPQGFNGLDIPNLMDEYCTILDNIIVTLETFFVAELHAMFTSSFLPSIRKRISQIEINHDFIVADAYEAFHLGEAAFYANYCKVTSTDKEVLLASSQSPKNKQSLVVKGQLQNGKYFTMYTKTKNLLRVEMTLHKNKFDAVIGNNESKAIMKYEQIFAPHPILEADCTYYLKTIFISLEHNFEKFVKPLIDDINSFSSVFSDGQVYTIFNFLFSTTAIQKHPWTARLIVRLVRDKKIKRTALSKELGGADSLSSLIDTFVRYNYLKALNNHEGYYKPINEFKTFIDKIRNSCVFEMNDDFLTKDEPIF